MIDVPVQPQAEIYSVNYRDRENPLKLLSVPLLQSVVRFYEALMEFVEMSKLVEEPDLLV